MADTYTYLLVRLYNDYEGRTSPIGCARMFDDFQVNFDPSNKEVRIKLSDADINQLKTWTWPPL